jgi:cell wall-associated NlpC family hydrolase
LRKKEPASVANPSQARTPASQLRRTRFRLPVLGLAVAAIASVVLPSGIGAASPSTHLTLSQAKAQVAALNAKAEKITEAYNNAHDQLTALQHKEQISARALARDSAQLTKVQAKLAKSAAAAYRTGGLSATMSLVSSGSPQTFLDQTSTLEEVARFQRDQVATATAAQRAMNQAKQIHTAQVAQQHKTVAAISSQRSQINTLLGQRRAVLNQLTAQARAAYSNQQAAATAHAVQQRATYNGPATGQASAAVRFAYAQLGKPYVYGGAGPSSYDCSGLTMRAWGAAGVGLPHNAAAQQSSIPAVSLSNLEPGDLVFFGSPAYHVAIYIGGGSIIQAPHTGASVEITPLSYMPPSGAGRP